MKVTTFQDKKIQSQSKKDFRIVQVKIDKIIHLFSFSTIYFDFLWQKTHYTPSFCQLLYVLRAPFEYPTVLILFNIEYINNLELIYVLFILALSVIAKKNWTYVSMALIACITCFHLNKIDIK